VKLRVLGNSLRLRLNRADIETFRQTGRCEEQVQFSAGSRLVYALEASPVTKIEAEYSGDRILVRVPVDMAREWVASDQVALSVVPPGGGLSLLIEKDFQCLHPKGRMAQDDADAFPNPEAPSVSR